MKPHSTALYCRIIKMIYNSIYSAFVSFALVIVLRVSLSECLDAEFGRIIAYDNFDHFKRSLNKSYEHEYHEERSRKAYEKNCQLIREHNEAAQLGKYSFELRANTFADLTPMQYLKKYVRLRMSPVFEALDHAHIQNLKRASNPPRNDLNEEDEDNGSKSDEDDDEDVPDALDWREMGFTTSAKNQKSCGSCYAFSIALSIEGQVFKRTGRLISLSEQQIVDCSIVLGNHGCAGGSLRNTLRYLSSTRGIMRADDYPYTSSQNRCDYRPDLAVVNITDWAILPKEDEEAMKQAVAKIGPIAISINASPVTFQLYSHGIYDDPMCASATVNHAMLVVGYTPEYWILKNWWGEHWGENGYMKIRRSQNTCGLSNYAAYAVV